MIVVVTFLFALLAQMVAPVNKYELGLLSERPPACQQVESDKDLWRGEWKGKATNWAIDESFRCERLIFEYGERDSFYDFVTQHASDYIRQAVNDIRKWEESNKAMDEELHWQIDVRADEAYVSSYVHKLLVFELASAKRPGKTLRQSMSKSNSKSNRSAVIKVTVRKVQDPDLLFQIELLKDERVWQL